MGPRRFIPSVEQLERRLMLSVTTSMAPGLESSAMVYEPPAIIADGVGSEFPHLEYLLTTEHDSEGHVLMVSFKNLTKPLRVGVVGGDEDWTRSDGTVRLQPPPGAHEFELTIANDQGQPVPFLHLELDESGHIDEQIPLMTMTSDSHHGNRVSLVGLYVPGGSHAHSAALTAMSGLANVASEGTADPGHMLSPSMVDQALTQHSGMLGMSGWTANNSGSGHPMPSDSVAGTDSSPADTGDSHMESETEGPAVMEMVAGASSQESMHEPVSASASEEIPETVLVGWFETEETEHPAESADMIPVEVERPLLPQSTVEVATTSATIPTVENFPVFENYPSMISVDDKPAEEGSQNSMWAVIGAIVLAVTAATGACILERRAHSQDQG